MLSFVYNDLNVVFVVCIHFASTGSHSSSLHVGVGQIRRVLRHSVQRDYLQDATRHASLSPATPFRREGKGASSTDVPLEYALRRREHAGTPSGFVLG